MASTRRPGTSPKKRRGFYHTMEVPGAGVQLGQWDLRKGIDAYLSGERFGGCRVLEIGTANGFVCFELEKRGAEVVAFDLAEGLSYDLVPARGVDREAANRYHAEGIRRIKNAFWWAYARFGSQARVVYGHANRIPPEIGPVDCVFLGNVLQHLENPLGALTGAAPLTRRFVITETNWVRGITDLEGEPTLYFLPSHRRDKDPLEWCFSWWQVSPELLSQWLEILGFRVTLVTEHEQYLCTTGQWVPHFTIAAERKDLERQ